MANTLRALLFSSLSSAESRGVVAGFCLFSHQHHKAAAVPGRPYVRRGWECGQLWLRGMDGNRTPRTWPMEMLIGKHEFPKWVKKVTYLPVKWEVTSEISLICSLRYLGLNLIKCQKLPENVPWGTVSSCRVNQWWKIIDL